MGADAFVAYYGVKFDIEDQAEMDLLSATTAIGLRSSLNLKPVDTAHCHPRVMAAIAAGLDWWWGSTQEEGYALMIGKELGTLGWENKGEVAVSTSDLGDLMADTRARLLIAGVNETAALHLHHEPDF